ncbi:MAG: hypothetical protein EWM72_01522 [Nitrospira sp.]|nr:MAG: hypothetical protein EWM72_01522 [Nitrospira sp.]
MKLLKEWWSWFWRQSRLNKVVIVGVLAALVPFLLPSVVSWFRPTILKVGVAFYTYERAYLLEGDTKTYFYEKRNLVSDCSLGRIQQPLPKGRAKTPDPQSWVLGKLLLENVSDQSITNLRVGVRSPLLHSTTTLFATPNVEATGKLEATSHDARHTYMVSITALAPMTSAVLSLKTPIDEKLRQFLYVDHRPVTVQVPFVSADQFRAYPPIVSRLNAMKILNRESVLRTGDETFADETIEVTMLRSDEPDLKNEEVSHSLLPKARVCSEGMAGVW